MAMTLCKAGESQPHNHSLLKAPRTKPALELLTLRDVWGKGGCVIFPEDICWAYSKALLPSYVDLRIHVDEQRDSQEMAEMQNFSASTAEHVDKLQFVIILQKPVFIEEMHDYSKPTVQ